MDKSKQRIISKILTRTKSIHRSTIPLFENFISLLNKNSIDYFLTGGTLLGCIRHKMCIPWDDDLDIFVFSSDMNKLYNIIKKTKGLNLQVNGNWQFIVKYGEKNICDIFTEKCSWWIKKSPDSGISAPIPEYPIIKKKFHGKNYNVSSNFHNELVFWYGSNYMTQYVFKTDHGELSAEKKNYLIISNNDLQEIYNIYNNIRTIPLSMIFQ